MDWARVVRDIGIGGIITALGIFFVKPLGLGGDLLLELIFGLLLFILGLIIGEIYFSAHEANKFGKCPFDVQNPSLLNQLEKSIDDSFDAVINLVDKLNISYIDAKLKKLEKNDSNEIKKIIADDSVGIIKTRNSDIWDFRALAMEFAKGANESIYATCIYPPEFWFKGDLLFDWSEFKIDPKKKAALLKNYLDSRSRGKMFKENVLWTEIEFSWPKTNRVEARSPSNSFMFSMELNGNHIDLKSDFFVSAKLIVDKTKVYSGDIKEIEHYKRYFKYICEKEGINKKRILIRDVNYDEEQWNSDADSIKEFCKYNKNVELLTGTITDDDIERCFYGDLLIFDRKIALFYDPQVKSSTGELIGLSHVVSGKLVDKYVHLFDAAKDLPLCDAAEYWRSQLS